MAAKACGFQKVKQFQHHAKVRRESSDDQRTQGLKLSAWGHMAAIHTGRVNVARANWPGLVGVQASSGIFDPTPRLVKAIRQTNKEMA